MKASPLTAPTDKLSWNQGAQPDYSILTPQDVSHVSLTHLTGTFRLRVLFYYRISSAAGLSSRSTSLRPHPSSQQAVQQWTRAAYTDRDKGRARPSSATSVTQVWRVQSWEGEVVEHLR